MCDRCTRVVCSKHIPLPEGTDLRNTVYICVACHLQVMSGPVPYFVSFSFSLLLCILLFLATVLIIFIIVVARVFTGATSPFCLNRQNLGYLHSIHACTYKEIINSMLVLSAWLTQSSFCISCSSP